MKPVLIRGATARFITRNLLPPIVAFALLLAAWELYVNWRDISIIVVPPPSAVIERFFEKPEFSRLGGTRAGVLSEVEACLLCSG